MSRANSGDQLEFIYNGVTVTTLAQIFGLDHKDVNKRIVGKVAPVSKPGDKNLRYRIRDAAPYLIDLKVNPEEYLKSLSPSKLPPALQDAFWKALLSRQKYEENRGDLWRTARVFEVVTSAFKVIRMTILMAGDTVSEQTQLSDRQREIITDLLDGLLRSLHDNLVEHFANYMPSPDEHGKPLEEEGALARGGSPDAQGEAENEEQEEEDDAHVWG